VLITLKGNISDGGDHIRLKISRKDTALKIKALESFQGPHKPLNKPDRAGVL
jgi:hypothetical protein